MSESEGIKRKSGIVEAVMEIAEMREEREYERWLVEKEEERKMPEKKMEEKQAIHINLISAAEMKAHTKEMRAENDRNFVRVLEVAGLTKVEAHTRVNQWHAQDGWY